MRSIPSNAAPAATKGTAPRYGQLRQPLPARAHPPPRRRHPSRLRLPHRHGSPPRPTGRRSTGPPFLGTARRGEPAAGGPDRRADRNARPAQHRTRTITAVPDTPGHTPRTFRTRLFLRPLRPPRKLRRRAHRQPEHTPGCARSARPRATQKNTTTDYNRLRHPDTTRRYNLPIR
ncbi:hypothetical protein HMPREF9450_00117 [Alistipes indistinctus YIT 12060]|uniref:Uncharacterized protein n=1 Tax=Alistipes indistinctus YIT 12060 TaxID=742725 RepID=G5H5A7_9BACT|nr:hypothetical protein HMPREF9450_00117 [Alistipes indistinctus YIT 12060]